MAGQEAMENKDIHVLLCRQPMLRQQAQNAKRVMGRNGVHQRVIAGHGSGVYGSHIMGKQYC